MDTLNNSLLIKTLATANMYHFLSLFFLPPTKELSKGLQDGSVANDIAALFKELGINPDGADFLSNIDGEFLVSGDLFTKMRRDYTTLFTHPKKPLLSLYEMQFRDKREQVEIPSTAFLNQAALHAEQCYRNAGLELSNESSREPGDHIAIELEFMGYVHTKLADALHRQDSDTQHRWKVALAEFSPHIENWGVDFFVACEDIARDKIYSWFGMIGKLFLSTPEEAKR